MYGSLAGSDVKQNSHVVVPATARPVSFFDFRYLDAGLLYMLGSTRKGQGSTGHGRCKLLKLG